MSTPEGKIQEFIIAEFTKRGGLVRKIGYEGRRGCADLLVAISGRLLLVEVKKDEATKPDAHQQREHERLRKRDIPVYIIGSERQASALVAKICAMN